MEPLLKGACLFENIFPEETGALLTVWDPVEPGRTLKGEPNFFWKKDEIWGHSQASAKKESDEWFASLSPDSKQFIFVFGLGAGYPFLSAKKWLEKPDHFLVFFEPSDGALQFFLRQPVAIELLSHPRVEIRTLRTVWNIESLLHRMIDLNFVLSALPTYQKRFKSQYEEIRNHFTMLREHFALIISEGLNPKSGFFFNLYNNMRYLPQSALFDRMEGAFKEVPAIILGAGPSLENHKEQLKNLQSRALIFAGGSGMNAAASLGIRPHFGAGVDPNPAQYGRILAQDIFFVPFFYRSRMHGHALETISGEKIYIPKSIVYTLTEKLEAKLGIGREDKPSLVEGFNVVQMTVHIASALGCNPIILSGIDLAYTGGRSYAGRVAVHPTQEAENGSNTKDTREETIMLDDLFGSPVQTNWKWFLESQSYEVVAAEIGGRSLIDGRSQGLPIEGLPRISLDVLEKKWFNLSYDFLIWIHGEIENATLRNELSAEKLFHELEDLKRQILESKRLLEKVRNGLKIDKSFFDEEFSSALKDFQKSEGYLLILSDSFQATGKDFFADKMGFFDSDSRAVLENLFHVFDEVLTSNLHALQFSLSRFNTVPPQPTPTKPEDFHAIYEDDGGRFRVFDTDLDVYIDEKRENFHCGWTSTGCSEETRMYPDGSKKWKFPYLDGQLHGLTNFWNPSGKVLGRGCFYRGKRVGRQLTYYSDGSLQSIQRFKDGLAHGKQEFFYPGGEKKGTLQYFLGVLDGSCRFYYPFGALYREILFFEGIRNGEEVFYYPDGSRESEARYALGTPVGTAIVFLMDGSKITESTYEDGRQVSFQIYDHGVPVAKALDPFQTKFRYIEEMFASLREFLQFLIMLSKMPQQESVRKEVEQLTESFTQLEELYQNLQVFMNQKDEKLWKGPKTAEMMQLHIEMMLSEFIPRLEQLHTLLVNIPPGENDPRIGS